LDFADWFREYEADLISLAESIDTSTPAGRLFFTIIAAMGQWEREEIASRVAASVPIRAQMGRPMGGPASYGYQWKDKKLVLNPEEAPIRKLIFELFLEIRRKKAVARELNERGYRTRDGAPWSDTTVDRLIRDSTAKGKHRVNYSTLTAPGKNGKRRWKLKDESEWVYHEVEPIVSEELWARCNTILSAQREKAKRPGPQPSFLFTGLVYCTCGDKMYAASKSPKYRCSKCRIKIPVEDLDRIYHDEIKGFLFSPERIAEHIEKADESLREKATLLTRTEGERVKVQGEIDKLHDLYQSGEIDKPGFGSRYRPLAARLRQLDDELPALQADLDAARITELSREEILGSARDVHAAWPTYSLNEKRQIVEAITERIVVAENEVSIDLFSTERPSKSLNGRDESIEFPSAPSSNSSRKAMDAQASMSANNCLRE
jgi:site-specific DNA recombinase